MPNNARLLIQSFRDVTVVNFSDSSILDTAQVQQIGDQLNELIDNRAIRKLILDFSKVKFLSSSALGVLITLRNKSNEIKGKVVLCSLRPDLRKIFKITNLDKLFDFHENEERALNSFGISTMG